ncbi:MAG: hypothetical protein RJB39_718, partial [Candidatus Parcubacteria bacterium]
HGDGFGFEFASGRVEFCMAVEAKVCMILETFGIIRSHGSRIGVRVEVSDECTITFKSSIVNYHINLKILLQYMYEQHHNKLPRSSSLWNRRHGTRRNLVYGIFW